LARHAVLPFQHRPPLGHLAEDTGHPAATDFGFRTQSFTACGAQPIFDDIGMTACQRDAG
jgi:hypothetical protein